MVRADKVKRWGTSSWAYRFETLIAGCVGRKSLELNRWSSLSCLTLPVYLSRAATTNLGSILTTARTRAVEAAAAASGGAQNLVHAASARIGTAARRMSATGESNGGSASGTDVAGSGAAIFPERVAASPAPVLPDSHHPAAAPAAAASLSATAAVVSKSASEAANSLLEAAAGLTRRTRESSMAAYHTAVQGIRKLTAPSRRVAVCFCCHGGMQNSCDLSPVVSVLEVELPVSTLLLRCCTGFVSAHAPPWTIDLRAT
jgi:hypothetical protein